MDKKFRTTIAKKSKGKFNKRMTHKKDDAQNTQTPIEIKKF